MKTTETSWWARFPYGPVGFSLPTGLVACPNPLALLILSQGAAYYVDVLSPAATRFGECFPVRQVFSSKEANCVLIAGNTRLSCFDKHGFTWTNKEVTFDDLEIIAIRKDVVEVRGFDPRDKNGVVSGIKMLDPGKGIVESKVNLKTGTTILP
ncbi:MAG: hypothetical protein WDO18_08665 [Acidobacteriota bacterium]